MIGLILTGHGEYAVGVGHALEMIAGKQEAFKVVPFRESEPMETLESNMKSAIIELQNTTEGIVVFADLLGGSPFKAAMLSATNFENVEVVVGTNLPMLIEIAMFREFSNNVQAVVTQSLNAGKEGIQHVVLSTKEEERIENDEEGI